MEKETANSNLGVPHQVRFGVMVVDMTLRGKPLPFDKLDAILHRQREMGED